MRQIKRQWKLILTAFAAGFVIATLAWALGVIPEAFSLFGLQYPLPGAEEAPQPADLCARYGIRISQPPGGYLLQNGQALIRGSFVSLPPYGNVRIMTIAETTPVTYWPQSTVTFDPSVKEWSAVAYAANDVLAAVVVLGDDGQILFDYFGKVVETAFPQGANYPGLTQLTKDMQTCDTVSVRQP